MFEEQVPTKLRSGAIGRGAFLDKFLIIDYRNKKVVFGHSDEERVIQSEQYNNYMWVEYRCDFNENFEISIPLFIGGEPKKLWLDTGTNESILNGIWPESVALGGSQKLSVKLNNELDLGELDFSLVTNSDFDLDGIIGFEFFNKYIVYLDFLKGKMFISPYIQDVY